MDHLAGIEMFDFNSIGSNCDTYVKKAIERMTKSVELMLIIEVSKVEPDCNEDTILEFAPNILKVCLEGSNVEHYYYMKSANEKVFLFKTYWEINTNLTNGKCTSNFNITK